MRACAAIIVLALSAVAAPGLAQTFPSHTITLIVPFPPGGSTDVAGRILAEKMGAALGAPVIVENVGGAGGSLGVGRLARAAPDGYTIDIGQWDTHVVASRDQQTPEALVAFHKTEIDKWWPIIRAAGIRGE